QAWDQWRKRGSQVRVLSAAVSEPPTRVHAELHQVRKTTNLFRARRAAAWQSAEAVETHGRRALRCQIRVKKLFVADLVVGVVGNVLRHILVEHFQRRDVS